MCDFEVDLERGLWCAWWLPHLMSTSGATAPSAAQYDRETAGGNFSMTIAKTRIPLAGSLPLTQRRPPSRFMWPIVKKSSRRA